MTVTPSHLQTLRSTLDELRLHTIPLKTQNSVREALNILDQIEDQFRKSEEQRRLAALFRISSSLGSSLELKSSLNHVMDAVIELTHAERGLLLLPDLDTGSLSIHAARLSKGENLDQVAMDFSKSIAQSVFESGQAVLTNNAQDDPRFKKHSSVVTFALRSVMCAPLLSAGRTIGVIYVDNRLRAGTFSQDDLDLLNVFAVQAAIAIDNASLYTRTDATLAARVAELETLTQINETLNARLELDFILETTQTWVLRGAGATSSWIALIVPDSPGLKVVAGSQVGKILDPLPIPVAQALRQTQPFILPSQEDLPAQMVVAIRQANQALGVISIEKPTNFTESEQAFVLRLATRAASAFQNARLFQEVQNANQAKSRFVSVVSHELRLPMTSIKGFTDLLLQGMAGELNAQQADFLKIIRNNVERMATLVSDLSDINRIESGRLKLELSAFPLAKSIEDVAASLGPKIQEKKQTLSIVILENLPRIYADPNRVGQVLTNLVSNASKYTPNEGQITVKAGLAEKGFVLVKIIDTGIGISTEDQAHLFEQFFRSENNQVREQQGWGLGLSVARNLVEIMGGKIGFESKLGQGTTFWFTLPIAVN